MRGSAPNDRGAGSLRSCPHKSRCHLGLLDAAGRQRTEGDDQAAQGHWRDGRLRGDCWGHRAGCRARRIGGREAAREQGAGALDLDPLKGRGRGGAQLHLALLGLALRHVAEGEQLRGACHLPGDLGDRHRRHYGRGERGAGKLGRAGGHSGGGSDGGGRAEGEGAGQGAERGVGRQRDGVGARDGLRPGGRRHGPLRDGGDPHGRVGGDQAGGAARRDQPGVRCGRQGEAAGDPRGDLAEVEQRRREADAGPERPLHLEHGDGLGQVLGEDEDRLVEHPRRVVLQADDHMQRRAFPRRQRRQRGVGAGFGGWLHGRAVQCGRGHGGAAAGGLEARQDEGRLGVVPQHEGVLDLGRVQGADGAEVVVPDVPTCRRGRRPHAPKSWRRYGLRRCRVQLDDHGGSWLGMFDGQGQRGQTGCGLIGLNRSGLNRSWQDMRHLSYGGDTNPQHQDQEDGSAIKNQVFYL